MFLSAVGEFGLPLLLSTGNNDSPGLSLLLIIELSQPGITRWSKISVNLAIPYWSISIALNVIITTYIAARLLYMRRRLRRVVTDGAVEYVSLTAMLIESAALYTINGLVFLVSFSVHSPIQYLALPLLGQTQVSILCLFVRKYGLTFSASWSC